LDTVVDPGWYEPAFIEATPVVDAVPTIEEINAPPHGALLLAPTAATAVPTPPLAEIAPSAMLPPAKLKVVPAITTLASPKGTLAFGEPTKS